MRARRVVAILFAVAMVLGLRLAPPVAAGTTEVATTNVSTATFVGEPDDLVIGGGTHVFRAGPDVVSVYSYGSSIQVYVGRGKSGIGYNLELFVPPSQTIGVGTYSYDQGSDSTGRPGVRLSGGDGCSADRGTFTVHDIGEKLSRLWATWATGCSGLRNTVFGEIRWNEPADADLVVTPSQITWPARPIGNPGTPVRVSLTNTGADPITISDASIADPGAFSVDNTCATIAPGATCAASVSFTPPKEGSYTSTLTLTDSSARGTHTIPLAGAGAPPSPPYPKPAPPPESADPPRPRLPWDYSMKKPVENFTAKVVDGNKVTLSWTLPDIAGGLKSVLIQGTAGSVPVFRETDGFRVYNGGATSVTTDELTLGAPYSFTAFAKYSDDPNPPTTYAGPSARVVVADGEISLALDKFQTKNGAVVTATGRVVDSQTGAAIANAPVRFLSHNEATDVYSVLTSVNADAQGNYTAQLRPSRTGLYLAEFMGDAQHMRGQSAGVFHVVDQTVTITANKKTVVHGTAVTISTVVTPAGGKVTLQQLVNGKWTTVTARVVDAKGRATFSVKPPKKGTYAYRLQSSGTATGAGGTSPTVSIKAT